MKLTLSVLETAYSAQTVLLKDEGGDEYSGFMSQTEEGVPAVVFGWKPFYSKEITPLQISLAAAQHKNLLYQIKFLVKAIRSRLVSTSENEVFIKDISNEKEIPIQLLYGLTDKQVYLLTHDIKPVTYKFHMNFADLINGKIVAVTRLNPVLKYLPPYGEKPIKSVKEHMKNFAFCINKSYVNHRIILIVSGDINEQEKKDILDICNKNSFNIVFEKEEEES